MPIRFFLFMSNRKHHKENGKNPPLPGKCYSPLYLYIQNFSKLIKKKKNPKSSHRKRWKKDTMYRKANQKSQYILADAIHIADTQNLQESGNRIKSHNEGGGKPQWDSVRSKRCSLIKMWGFFFKLRRGGCVESKREELGRRVDWKDDSIH